MNRRPVQRRKRNITRVCQRCAELEAGDLVTHSDTGAGTLIRFSYFGMMVTSERRLIRCGRGSTNRNSNMRRSCQLRLLSLTIGLVCGRLYAAEADPQLEEILVTAEKLKGR